VLVLRQVPPPAGRRSAAKYLAQYRPRADLVDPPLDHPRLDFLDRGPRLFREPDRPDSAEEIQVTAKQFAWIFTYPDGDASTELHLVQDRPVRLVLRSDDVLHSFYVAAFRQKKDIVPGRYTEAYIVPTMLGKYRLACTEYCGDGHSRMRTLCEVHVDDAERKAKTLWLNTEHTPVENGERLFNMNCAGCHDINGAVKTGPALNLVWGKQERLVGGSTVLVDENYFLESLENPDAKVVEGFGPKSQMQTFAGKFKPEEIDFLIAYIKKINNVAGAEDTGTSAASTGDGAAAPADQPAPDTTAPDAGGAAPATNEGTPDR
jgi:cytochrome c2